MNHFLITGVSGFVGSALAASLAEDGVVVGMSRTPKAVAASRGVHLNGDIVQGLPDMQDMQGANVIHCAGSMKNDDRDQLWLANVVATRNVLEWCVRNEAQQLVFFSSGSVYGYNEGKHMRETDPLNPIGYYGYTKQIAEQLCLAYQALYGLRVSILRLYFPFGTGQKRGIFRFIAETIRNERPLFIKRRGAPRMTPTHIADIIAAARACLSHATSGATYNLCGSESLSFLDAVRRVETILGRAAVLKFTDDSAGDLLGDNTRLRDELGWSPRFGIGDLASCIS